MAFDRARAEIQKERPASFIRRVPVLERICASSVLRRTGKSEAFAATPHQWPAYPDSHAGLKALQAHARVGALSNIDNASLEVRAASSISISILSLRLSVSAPTSRICHTSRPASPISRRWASA